MIMNKITATALLILMGSFCHAAELEYFSLMKDLAAPAGAAREVGACDLDEQVLDKTEGDYANIRILDDNKQETPYLVRPKRRKKTVVHEYTVRMKEKSFETLPDNRVQIVLHQNPPTDEPLGEPEVLILSTRIRNFEKEVTVHGSRDGSKWELLAEAQPIFDYSRFIDIRNDRIEIKRGPYKQYRIEISNMSEKHESPLTSLAREKQGDKVVSETERLSFRRADFRIESITFRGKKSVERKTKSVTREYTAENFSAELDKENKETVLTFSVSCVPLTKLAFISDDSNFSRRVTIEGSKKDPVENDWRRVSTSNISRIRLGRFRQDHTDISLSGLPRFRWYRVKIRNLDSPPLTITGVTAVGEVHEAVFFCKKERKYRMYFGATGMNVPRYDIADVLRRTEGEDTDAYELGDEEENPESTGEEKVGLGSHKGWLVAAGVFMVVALVWVIATSLKNVESLDSKA
jgi:hypothetical protein